MLQQDTIFCSLAVQDLFSLLQSGDYFGFRLASMYAVGSLDTREGCAQGTPAKVRRARCIGHAAAAGLERPIAAAACRGYWAEFTASSPLCNVQLQLDRTKSRLTNAPKQLSFILGTLPTITCSSSSGPSLHVKLRLSISNLARLDSLGIQTPEPSPTEQSPSLGNRHSSLSRTGIRGPPHQPLSTLRLNTLPGPNETIVSSTHGNAALSDAAHPVAIAHHSQGVVLTPPSSPLSPSSTTPSLAAAVAELGKVHFPLPTLRSPEEETLGGSLAAGAIVSAALEVAVAPPPPHPSHDDDRQPPPPLHAPSKITQVELFAGRDLLWSSGQADGGTRKAQHQQGPLPADRDLRIHIESVIYGKDDAGMRFNENQRGLGVTLTVEFRGERPGLMVSSVALVQMMGSRR